MQNAWCRFFRSCNPNSKMLMSWQPMAPNSSSADTAMPKPSCAPKWNELTRKAGLKPWPNLFQNMQSTRQTELAERFAAHVVRQRIGKFGERCSGALFAGDRRPLRDRCRAARAGRNSGQKATACRADDRKTHCLNEKVGGTSPENTLFFSQIIHVFASQQPNQQPCEPPCR
jgi:hypothetical protein